MIPTPHKEKTCDGKCKRCERSEMDDVAICDNLCGCHKVHACRPAANNGYILASACSLCGGVVPCPIHGTFVTPAAEKKVGCEHAILGEPTVCEICRPAAEDKKICDCPHSGCGEDRSIAKNICVAAARQALQGEKGEGV